MICRNFPKLVQLSILFNGVEGSGVPAHVVHEMICEKRIQKFGVRVDSGTEDYCANNGAISHPLADESHNPEHVYQYVFALVISSGEYVITKLSFQDLRNARREATKRITASVVLDLYEMDEIF